MPANASLALLLMSMAAGYPAEPDIKLTSAPVTRELTLPELPSPHDHYALRVIGISVAPGHSALFRVFVELPEADRSTPSDSGHYVGQASILAGPSRAPKNVLMPLNWAHQHKLKAGTRLRFTLIPIVDNADNPIQVERLEITVTRS